MKRTKKKKIFRVVYKLFLIIIGFTIGLAATYILFYFVLTESDFHDAYQMAILVVVAIFLSFGFAFSRQIRCLTILTFPEFGSNSGKRTIQAYLIIVIMIGPIRNIGRNGEEVVRFTICLKDLTWNITMAGKDLLLAPFQHVLHELKIDEAKSKYNMTAIQNIMQPLANEVEETNEVQLIHEENDEIDSKIGVSKRSEYLETQYKVFPEDLESVKIEKTYKKKMAYRCEEIFTMGTEKCYDIFKNKYDECTEAISPVISWALCWPMKLRFICNVLSGIAQEQVCDFSEIVQEGFGQNYISAKKSLSDLGKKFSKVKIDYQAISNWVNVDDLKATQEQLLEQFVKTRALIEYYMKLLQKILSFSFLFVVFSSLKYQNKYLNKLSFDNHYITKYFHKIDNRRKEASKSHLLPLKSFEKQDFHKVFKLTLNKDETGRFISQLIAAIAQTLLVSIFFFFDFVFSSLLQLIGTHAKINLHQEGKHVLKIEIRGEGIFADLLRKIIKDINIKKKIDIEHLTHPCLPDVRFVNKAYLQKAGLLLLALYLLAYFNTICRRLLHIISNFFYPKRSKKRIIWLYNQTLRKRRGQLTHLKRRALDNGDKILSQVDLNPLSALAEIFPRFCSCLKWCRKGQRKCVLCTQPGEIYNCPICGFSFCSPCFKDVDQRCLYCIAKNELLTQMYFDQEGYEQNESSV